ncbi:hypothetical protein [Streptomyces sp. YIM 132580]|uniref:hypothetical protein n=1 Tax=unclassified Streptomyces TaxID=2593676 RepID=UPI0013708D38|nr:hypothetical protein [Streptomyces sp. YIM 132580]MXG30015.1 hypothetical protein [Streptomyces sp. YIM 132580]
MRLNRSWGIGLVTAALVVGGGATIANAASSHRGDDRPAVVLPDGDGPGVPAGDGPGVPASGDSEAYPLPEGDSPGTPAGDETYRL